MVLGGHEIAGRIQLIFVHGFLLPDGFGRNGYRTLAGFYPRPREAVCHHAVGLRAQQFVGRHALPEIDAIDLKEFPSGLAKQTDERLGRGTLSGGIGELQQEALKGVVRARIATLCRRILGRDGQSVTVHPLSKSTSS